MPPRRPRRIPPLLVVLLLVFVVDYTAMPGSWLIGDPFAWRAEAQAVLVHHRLWVDDADARSFGDPGQFFVYNPRTGHWYSKYGPANALVAAPALVMERLLTGRWPEPLHPRDLLPYNLNNLALSMLLAVALYQLAGPYTKRPLTRGLFVFACCYPTFLWYFLRAQSGELPQTLFFTAAFAALSAYLARGARGFLLLSWLFIALLVLTRPVFVLLLPAVALAAAVGSRTAMASRGQGAKESRFRLDVSRFTVVPPVLIAVLLLGFNYVKFGSPLLTGYDQWRRAEHLPVAALGDGVVGFIFDPQYSVFLYFPPLLLALVGWPSFFRAQRGPAVAALLCFVPIFLYIAKIPTWRGEYTYGPRYLLFALPVLSLPAILVFDRLIDERRRGVLGVIAIGLLYSTWLQVQVIRLDFYAYYTARDELPGRKDDLQARYFYTRPLPFICHDLIDYAAHPEDLPFVKQIPRDSGGDPAAVGHYLSTLRRLGRDLNFHWSAHRPDPH